MSLREEEPEFLFQQRDVICELLRAAEACGPDMLRDVRSELHCVAFNGIRTSSPGDPPERDLALRDAALEAAAACPERSVERNFFGSLATLLEENANAVVRRFKEESL
jgi:hypothetical protein